MVKLCIECKHFRWSDYGDLCLRRVYTYVSPVRGTTQERGYLECARERTLTDPDRFGEDRCGYPAKYWEAKENTHG